MIVNTPYTECYVKKSFLSGEPKFGQDETVFGVIVSIRFIRGRAPLFMVYLPEFGAFYDKVDQCAIFQTPYVPDDEITQNDVAWWDCLSTDWQLIQLQLFRGWDLQGSMRTGRNMEGTYLWTCDPQKPEANDYGQAAVWHEHKTKNFAFDFETGVLFCVPNNKARFVDSSLTPDELQSPSWLRVYKDMDEPSRVTHECDRRFGHTDQFDYSE